MFRHSFPVNDGGMFYAMARDLQDSNYLLPAFSSYNGGEIPFVYPPLTLYMAALVDTLTPASLMMTFSILPFVGSVFVLWSFYRLALAVLPDRWAVSTATLAFALAPRSFIWLVMGGGLPRAFGLAFALLAAREAYLLATGDYSRRRAVLAGLFAALTAVTHLETAAFLGLTFVVIALMRPATGIRRIGLAGLAATAFSAPWLIGMVARHGLRPFESAMGEGGRLLNDGGFSFDWIEYFLHAPVHTSEPYFPLIGALGLIGAIYAVARGDWFLPVWWLVTGLIGMRAFPTYVTIVTCLLAGVTVARLIVPALVHHTGGMPSNRQKVAITTAAVFSIWFATTGAVTIHRGEVGMYMESLSKADRDAMAWIDARTPENATFAVVPVDTWPGDYPAEWFPVLAHRASLTTPQGYEWVEGEFDDRTKQQADLLACSNQEAWCIDQVLDGTAGISHIYVPASCCDALKESLRDLGNGVILYDRGGALVIRRSALAGADLTASRP